MIRPPRQEVNYYCSRCYNGLGTVYFRKLKFRCLKVLSSSFQTAAAVTAMISIFALSAYFRASRAGRSGIHLIFAPDTPRASLTSKDSLLVLMGMRRAQATTPRARLNSWWAENI